MRSLFFFLSSLLLLAGCNSLNDPTTGTTTVSGQVVEGQSQKPVPNATVQVWHAGMGGGYGRVGWVQLLHGVFQKECHSEALFQRQRLRVLALCCRAGWAKQPCSLPLDAAQVY